MFPANTFVLELFASWCFLGAGRKTSSHWKTIPLLFPLAVASGFFFFLLPPVGCTSHHLVFLLLSALTLHLLVSLLSVLLLQLIPCHPAPLAFSSHCNVELVDS